MWQIIMEVSERLLAIAERLEVKVNAKQEVKNSCCEVTKACLEDSCWSKGDEGLLKRGGGLSGEEGGNSKGGQDCLGDSGSP